MRALLAIALLFAACAPPTPQEEYDDAPDYGARAVIGSGTIRPNRASGGAASDPTPVFDFNPSLGSGVSRLTSPDALAMTTTVLCDARTATASNFPCTTGGTFTEADGDVIVGCASCAAPYTESGMRSTHHDRFYSYEAPTTTLAEVPSGTDVRADIIAFLTDRGATQYVLAKYDTATSQGWGIRVTAGGVVQGVANADTFGSYQLDAEGEWNHYTLICSVDTCSLYVNGYVTGSTAARSGTLATVTNAKNLAIGCRPNGTNNDCIQGKVAWTRVQTCSSCVVNGTVAATLQKSAQEIMGVWPTNAVTPAPLSTDTRASRASLVTNRDYDAVARIFRVGSKWLRVAQRKESGTGGAYHTGYLSEGAATNKILRGTEFDNAAWTDLTAADSYTADIWVAPVINKYEVTAGAQTTQAERMAAAVDLVGLEHGSRQAVTLTAANHVLSVFFGYDGTAPTTKQCAFIRDNTIGATAIGVFDIKNCVPLIWGAGLATFTSGPYAAARTQYYGKWNSTQEWCRAQIVVLGTAAAHDIDYGWSGCDGDTTFTTSAGEQLGAIYGAQVELATLGAEMTSYQFTTTATTTRNLDGLQFNIDNWPTSGTLYWEVMFNDTRIANGTGNAAPYSATPYKDANNFILLKGTQATGLGLRSGTDSYGGGVYVDVITAGANEMECCGQAGFGQFYAGVSGLGSTAANQLQNLHDGQRHRARLVYATNNVRAYFDGDQTPGAADITAVTLPTLTGGHYDIGYESASGGSQGNGILKRVENWDVEFEPEFP